MNLEQALNKYEPVIGIEIHAQLNTNSKAYCSDVNVFGSIPNTNISPISLGHPGTLPVFNEKVLNYAVKMGLACNSKISKSMHFDRKNYFYADLPQGYQISQYKHPIIGEGAVTIDFKDGSSKDIRIVRLHLEQDAGKSLHDQNPSKTYVDLNRSGVALMEIVSEPDLNSSHEASLYITKIRSILMYLDTCDGNMQEGSLRTDVNISVRKPGEELGTRCEIKNLNSIKFIKQAIEYEAMRQIKIIEEGGIIEQNTLLFNPQLGKTKPMRSKEEAHDYRYFPDPDLLPLKLEDDFIEIIKKDIPEDIPVYTLSSAETLVSIMVGNNLVSSNGDAKRMIKQGAVKLDDKKVFDLYLEVAPDSEKVLKVGKRKFLRITV